MPHNFDLHNKKLDINEINSYSKESAIKRKKHGVQMFTMLFALFLMIVGVTIGVTYSAFQSTATSNGTITFSVNGHQGTFALSNTQVESYNTSNDTTTVFTLTSDTGYTTPVITAITMGSTSLTKDGNNFKSGTNIVATYSSGTLTINNIYVTGNLAITGSSTANTYTVTIARNNTSYGTVTQDSVTGVPYGSSITTSGDTLTVNGVTITATPTNVAGYTTVFSGWSVPAGKVTSATTVTANFTRTANPTPYIVTLDNQGADTPGSTIVMAEGGQAMPSITIPTKEYCVFGGYYTSPQGAGTLYYNANGTSARTFTYGADLTLYAKWMGYLEFVSPTNNITISTGNSAKNWSGTLEYCLSTPTSSTSWTTWTGTSAIGGTSKTIYLRGKNNTTISTYPYTQAWTIACASNDVSCNGNIMSLLDCTKAPVDNDSFTNFSFRNLFCNCATLVSAPELPATTLSSACYCDMFKGCTNLVNVPSILPATMWSHLCYASMFEGCTSLITAPEFPQNITGVDYGNSCCSRMFEDCTSLTTAPTILPLLDLTDVDYCYSSMFSGCSNLTEAPKLPATKLSSRCYDDIFCGCISLTEAPKLPATTLAERCYYGMFQNCTSLTEAPALPATDLTGATYCYNSMFSGCTSLTEAPALPATDLTGATYCYNSMFSGCTSLTEAPELPATTLADYCYDEMFYNCKSLVEGPTILPATTLVDGCYYHMFYYCTSLVKAPELSATTLANSCYKEMFYNCTSLVEGPTILPATTLADYCYSSMFCYCKSLLTAPILPATTLADYCYSSMFSDCESLITAPILPATTLADYCYQYMFSSCKSLITFPELPATTLTDNCYYGMFQYCSNLKISTTPTGIYQTPYRIPSSGTGTAGSSSLDSMFSSLSPSYVGTPSINTTYYTSNQVVGENVVNGFIHLYAPKRFCLKPNNGKTWNGDMEYLTTGGWTAWDGSAIVANSIYLRGTGNTVVTGSNNNWILIGENIRCNGNIENLLDYATVVADNHPTMANYCFSKLFYDCPNLITAPTLPATTLASYCYQSMFYNCSGLTKAPELPAMSAPAYCYNGMFYGCTGLTTAPALPATTVATYCYNQMFYGCSSLTTAPLSLSATAVATYCYSEMFYGCSSLTTAPSSLPATDLTGATYCYNKMFYGCSSLTTAPTLSATTVAAYCCSDMFSRCSSLTTAPTLSATTLADHCYSGMFYYCTSLTTAPALPATTVATYCYYQMFSYCTSLTTAPVLPATNLTGATWCYSSMFYNCESLTTAPALPATTLSNYCYYQMFSSCRNLDVIPSLTHITTWASSCCTIMFSSCSKVKIYASSGTGHTTEVLRTGSTACFSSMFSSTGGDFKSTPSTNTSYYTSNAVINPDGTITPANS